LNFHRAYESGNKYHTYLLKQYFTTILFPGFSMDELHEMAIGIYQNNI